jgi:hypothetical protein
MNVRPYDFGLVLIPKARLLMRYPEVLYRKLNSSVSLPALS